MSTVNVVLVVGGPLAKGLEDMKGEVGSGSRLGVLLFNGLGIGYLVFSPLKLPVLVPAPPPNEDAESIATQSSRMSEGGAKDLL